MKKLGIAACAAMTLSFFGTTANAKSVVVYNQKLKASKVCGAKYSKSGCASTKDSLVLDKYDISVQRDSAEQPIYASVLGRFYETGDKNIFGGRKVNGSLVSLNTCGLTSDYFAAPSPPYDFYYTKKASSAFNASASVNVKDALVAAGVSATELEQLQAKFDATYGKALNSKYTLKGAYFRIELSDDTIQKLKGNIHGDDNTSNCRQRITSLPNRFLIWSIALVRLDTAEYTSDIAEKIAADFAAQVQKKDATADIASLKLSIRKEVTKTLEVSFKDEWRVIAWDYFKP